MNDLISVIIPIYNVEKYLTKCVESIIMQSYKNIEIILVDDGSPDKSGALCDEFAEKDKRITVIHQKNKGLSGARNSGLEIAKGEYILFIDSDDWIDKTFIETLYKNALEYSAEICVPGFCLSYENGRRINDSRVDNLTVYCTERALECFLFNGYLTPCVASKLWKKSLWNDVKCPEGKLFEDQYTTYKLIAKADRIIYNPLVKYYYFKREESIGHGSFGQRTYDLLGGIKEEYEFVTSKYPTAISSMNVARAFWELVFVNIMINSEKYDVVILKEIQRRTKGCKDDIKKCEYIDNVRKGQLLLFSYSIKLYKFFYRIYKFRHRV